MLSDADVRLLEAFEDGSLPPDAFDHEGHVHAAWCCLIAYGEDAGRERFVTALRQFVRIHGADGKYHDTITRAFLDMIAVRARGGGDWARFRRRHAAVIDDGMDLLLRHYSHDRLFSEEARAGYVAPDLAPFAVEPASAGGDRR